ncbi:MAG: hypothetical protein ACI8X5_003320 [Planctomycetota bacterium]
MSDHQQDPIATDWCGLRWSLWIPLNSSAAEYRASVSPDPGFYKIRAVGDSRLAYIGQTGRNLRERTRALARGVNRGLDHPPWNDPHTAAGAMWAFRHEDGYEFEVSVVTAMHESPARQCLEDFLLHQHRIHRGGSTLLNHGRLHPMWTRPSNRAKGQPMQRLEEPVDYESLPVARGDEALLSGGWLGLNWTDEEPLSGTPPPAQPGVYLIRRGGEVIYFGQSVDLANRLGTHAGDPRFQGGSYRAHVMPGARPHHLLERETDIIGAFFELEGVPPAWQYRT